MRREAIAVMAAAHRVSTWQALLANISAMYGMYHGPDGLSEIAGHCQSSASLLRAGLVKLGCNAADAPYFDTIRVSPPAGMSVDDVMAAGVKQGVNFRRLSDTELTLACDETTSVADIEAAWRAFGGGNVAFTAADLASEAKPCALPASLVRNSTFMEHPIFNTYHSESQMLRCAAGHTGSHCDGIGTTPSRRRVTDVPRRD